MVITWPVIVFMKKKAILFHIISFSECLIPNCDLRSTRDSQNIGRHSLFVTQIAKAVRSLCCCWWCFRPWNFIDQTDWQRYADWMIWTNCDKWLIMRKPIWISSEWRRDMRWNEMGMLLGKCNQLQRISDRQSIMLRLYSTSGVSRDRAIRYSKGQTRQFVVN